MKGRFENEHEEDSTTTPPENAVGSPLSGEEAAEESYMPSPKQSKRSTRKTVVTVPIGDGFRSKSDVYPPPDSCSWRKYGQKPIKGSPYPRGYYRCSSSKGCPAKKQVERSRHDPTTLLITYSCEHNHSLPNTTTATKNNHKQPAAASSSSTTTTTTTPPANFSSEESATFANQTDIEPNSFAELAGEFGWLNEVDSILIDDRTTLITPTWAHTDMEVVMPIGEEDELLFGDLGDLPESAVVFRHSHWMESCDPL